MPRAYAVELRLGWLYYLSTNHIVSAEHYRAASDVAPRAVEPRLGLLLPLLASSRFIEAEFTAREILREHQTHYLAHRRLATALRWQQKLGEAGKVLTHALKLYPSDAALLAELGLVKAEQKELATARALFNEALTLDPDNDLAFAQLADPKLFADLAQVTAPSSPGFARTPGFRVGDTAARFDAVAYGGTVDYHGSVVKSRALLSGASGFLSVGAAHLFEGGYDGIDITRLDGSHLHQHDVMFAYDNFSLANWKLRAGAHYLLSDDARTDGGWVVFGGATHFAPRWDAGVDAFASHYHDYAPQLDVYQLSPHFGCTLAQGATWTLRNDVKGHWIHAGDAVGLTRQNFFSAEERVSFFWREYSLAAFGWAGRQAFAVRADGATLFNLAEQHRAGCGAELKRTLGTRTALAFRFSREEFREFAASGTAAAHTFLGFVGVTF